MALRRCRYAAYCSQILSHEVIDSARGACWAAGACWPFVDVSALDETGCAVPGSTSKALALSILQSRESLRSYEELLSGRPLDVTVERTGAEHAGE